MSPPGQAQDRPLRQAQDRLCVGLTGGIGCGKSTVAKMFQERGALIIDADEIAHQLTQADGCAIDAIRAAFGDRYITPDGSLDRAKMRELIFSDGVAKHTLERLLHPLILDQAQRQIMQVPLAPYIVMVVPLLLESPAFLQLVQRILVVDCDESRQVERVMQRSKLSEAEVRTIMAQQAPRQQRLSAANDVIHNNGGFTSLTQQVEALHNVYFAAGKQNGD